MAGLGLVGAGAYLLARGSDQDGGKAGRAYERFRGITGSEAQYKRSGGGEVHYTKKGQPFVYDSKGRPKFIKRSKT